MISAGDRILWPSHDGLIPAPKQKETGVVVEVDGSMIDPDDEDFIWVKWDSDGSTRVVNRYDVEVIENAGAVTEFNEVVK